MAARFVPVKLVTVVLARVEELVTLKLSAVSVPEFVEDDKLRALIVALVEIKFKAFVVEELVVDA